MECNCLVTLVYKIHYVDLYSFDYVPSSRPNGVRLSVCAFVHQTVSTSGSQTVLVIVY